MWKWLYRRAVDIKEFGERVKIRVIITFGLWARDKILRRVKNKAL